MDTFEARALILAAFGELSWEGTKGHPDDVRIDMQARARQLAEDAVEVLVVAAHRAGEEAMRSALGGQARLPL